MKFNYTFPYKFFDLSVLDENYVNIEYSDDGLKFTFQDLPDVNDSEIELVLELESSQTFYRRVFKPNSRDTVYVPYDQLGAKAKYCFVLVAAKTGNISFNNNSDYYEQGDCMGILQQDLILIEEVEGLSGLIKVAASDREAIEYDLTSDWITIKLPRQTYENYVQWQRDSENVPYILASLANACIQYALISARHESIYRDKVWFEVIHNGIIEMGYDDFNEIDSHDIPQITNRFLGNCLQKMLALTGPQNELNNDPFALSE